MASRLWDGVVLGTRIVARNAHDFKCRELPLPPTIGRGQCRCQMI